MFAQLGILRHRDDGTPPITGGVLTIGVGTSLAYQLPINAEDTYGKTGIIWTAAELGGAKTITEIEFFFRSYSPVKTFTNQTIKMALVDEATFLASPDMSFSDLTLTGLVTAKSGFTHSITSNNLWYSFVLDTPFVYDGVKNLIIIWENNMGTWDVNYGGTNTATVANTVASKSGVVFPITGIGTRSSKRPNIKIHY